MAAEATDQDIGEWLTDLGQSEAESRFRDQGIDSTDDLALFLDDLAQLAQLGLSKLQLRVLQPACRDLLISLGRDVVPDASLASVGAESPKRGGAVPISAMPKDKIYSAKMDGKKVTLQLSDMGLVVNNKGKMQTLLFQSLLSWETKGNGFEVYTNKKDVLQFACDDANQIVEEMRGRATHLANHGGLMAQPPSSERASSNSATIAATSMMIPLDKSFDAKLNGAKIQLQVSGMGLRYSGRKKTEATTTLLFQSLISWEMKDCESHLYSPSRAI
jgi:hypothetical protein